jgi:hypothetical protein
LNKFIISAATLTALALQGCTKPPPPPVSTTRVFAHDLAGKAAFCTAPASFTPVNAKDNPVAIATGGNGWCGVPVRSASGAPYTAGLLTEAAHNGKVIVHTVGDDTRIDYVAKAGPVSPDSFAVRLIPGDAVVRVAVSPPAAASAPATPAAPPAPGK